ncbi:YbaN family protein [Paraclostridium bifermentans]|uniref:YbaN family protein n=1 Tax=Paraclostridium bifermentans TaxID=1490 RepID=UPI00359C6BBC
MNKIKKYLYLVIGLLSFGIGSIGVALPVIPTTPFLLLASFCFIRGSEKFNKRFKSTKIYKNHVESFINEKAMTMKRKITILSLVSIMISIPIILVDNLHVRIFLIALICIKFYYFIFKIKTIKPNNIINIK